MIKKWLNRTWQSKEYEESKKISFEMIDSFLTSPPKRILDIGCGLAFESEMFQQKYNSELYLLDGDFEATQTATRDRKYGTVESMAFYTKISNLQDSFNQRNLKYIFVDANNINLPQALIFDLVYSNVSCGYHYPLSTYLNLLENHTNKDSVLIFDIHSTYLEEQIAGKFDVLGRKSYPNQKKIIKCKLHIRRERHEIN